LISRRRRVPSNRRIDSAVREHFMDIVRERYADFGPQLAHEYLAREHGLTHSVETLRGWMQASGLWQARRRRAVVVHSPRARRPCVSELVQIDGSHHDWFEGRGPRCCLIAFIDDATSRVQAAHLCQAETAQDYLMVLRQYVLDHGVPAALYSICALHHQRHLSSQLSCQFEGDILQIEQAQPHAPRGRARVDIAQHPDGSLEVIYHGHVLGHRRFTVNEHLKGSSRADDKQLNGRVDQAIERQRTNIARLRAHIAHQDSQRAAGIYVAHTPASAPPCTPPGRYGLRPSQPGGVHDHPS
jgi:hypothetical protein